MDLKCEILNVQYHPGRDSATALVEHQFGTQFYINLSQEKLAERAGNSAPWGDEEVLAEAQAILDTSEDELLKKFRGHTLTFRPAPEPPVQVLTQQFDTPPAPPEEAP